MVMKHVAVMPAGEFKAKCLAVLDAVERTRQGVVVTKRGKPVARIVPVECVDQRDSLRGSILEQGDIVAPLTDVWETK